MHKSKPASEHSLHCKDCAYTETHTHTQSSLSYWLILRMQFSCNIKSTVGMWSWSSAYQRCGPKFRGKQHFNGWMGNRINTPNEAHMEAGRWPRAKYLRRACPCFNDAEERERWPESMHSWEERRDGSSTGEIETPKTRWTLTKAH